MRSRSFSDEPGPQLRERRVSIEKMTVSGARYWLPKEESVLRHPLGSHAGALLGAGGRLDEIAAAPVGQGADDGRPLCEQVVGAGGGEGTAPVDLRADDLGVVAVQQQLRAVRQGQGGHFPEPAALHQTRRKSWSITAAGWPEASRSPVSWSKKESVRGSSKGAPPRCGTALIIWEGPRKYSDSKYCMKAREQGKQGPFDTNRQKIPLQL